MFPFSILRVWILGLLALAVVGVAGYLIWNWYEGDGEREYLWWGIGLLAVSYLGPWLFMPLLGKPQFGEPLATREGESQRIRRPDGTELHVEFYGPPDAQPIVLTHGWSLNSTVWYYLKRELSQDFRIIVWDLPGLGKSSRPESNDYSLEKMAGDLSAVIGIAGRPAVVLGHSIGGMILLTFCRLFPDRLGTDVSGIVLVGTTYTNPLKTTTMAGVWRALQKPLIEPLLHLTIWLSPLVWLMNLQSYRNGSTHLSTRFASFAGKQTWGQVDFISRLSSFASPAVTSRGMLAMLRFDAQATLPQIDVPTLVVGGRNDRLIKIDASEHLRQAIPSAQLVVLEPAGHQVVLEQHEALSQAVRKFALECEYHQPARSAS